MKIESQRQRRAGFTFQVLCFTVVLFVAWSVPPAYAGSLDSPAVPGDDSGRMYALDEIESKIAGGTTTAAAGDVLSGKAFITRIGGSGYNHGYRHNIE